jgi:hypothetical protein
MSETATSELFKDVGRKAIRLSETLPWKKAGERWLHGVVLGLFEAKIGHMDSEFAVEDSLKVKTKPKCIDFRHGGNNPVVIELVVRLHGPELYGGPNESELKKLCRIPYSKARRRILLLLDASGFVPIQKNSLKRSYNKIGSGRGNFTRETVTVIYVHPKLEYSFRWNP